MKNHFLLVIMLLAINSNVFSQSQRNRCGTYERVSHKLKENPNFLSDRLDMETATQKWISTHAQQRSSSILTIPVVIHVVYRTNAENISDAQVQSQLDVLNADYRRLNVDTSKTPKEFRALAVDCQIQFCLAKQDPSGKATNGITRKQTSTNNIGSTTKYYSSVNGGEDIWNPNAYMNIWVCNIDGGNTLGFAYLPGTTGTLDDGLVIDYRFFGTIGMNPPYHLGRTVTHEVGHYLNLEHIWGDDNGACTGTDYVADTPNQGAENYGCPKFPITNDPCTPAFPGIMFMNYMDYTDDSCMNMFTKGQKQRMVGALNGPRISLQASKACQIPASVMERIAGVSAIYPNPSNGIFNFELQSSAQGDCLMEVFNLMGKLILQKKVFISADQIKFDLSDQASGIYFLKVKIKDRMEMHKLIVDHSKN